MGSIGFQELLIIAIIGIFLLLPLIVGGVVLAIALARKKNPPQQ